MRNHLTLALAQRFSDLEIPLVLCAETFKVIPGFPPSDPNLLPHRATTLSYLPSHVTRWPAIHQDSINIYSIGQQLGQLHPHAFAWYSPLRHAPIFPIDTDPLFKRPWIALARIIFTWKQLGFGCMWRKDQQNIRPWWNIAFQVQCQAGLGRAGSRCWILGLSLCSMSSSTLKH